MENQSTHVHDTLQSFISDGTPEAIKARYGSLSWAAAQADYGELDRNIVVIDTETTGLSFNHDELTQIAAARMEKGKIVDWYITFVNPGKPIPEEIAYLTDIHDSDVADAPSPSEALAELVKFVGDANIVAHNAEFDRTFTTKHPSGYPLLERTWMDSLDLARIALPRLKSHRLIDLVRAFGAPLSTHRADDDVASTCAIFRILLAAVDAMPVALVREIAGMAMADQWPTQAVFEYFAARKENERTEKEEGTKEGQGAKGDEGIKEDEGVKEGQGTKERNGAEACERNRADFSRAAVPPAFTEESYEGQQSMGDAFASVYRGERGGKSAPGADRDGHDEARRRARRFSLRDLRKARLGNIELRPKVDADDIAADPHRELVFPLEEDIEEAFSPKGLVGSLYPDFEARQEQVDMAEAVRTAFSNSENLVVEAGTGVGKSMAYLVPAALTARANGIAVGVATKTNALLDQLVYHELPALATALGPSTTAGPALASQGSVAPSPQSAGSEETAVSSVVPEPASRAASALPSSAALTHPSAPLTFAPLKGFSHYPCLRKIDRVVSEGPQMKNVAGKERSQAPALAALLSFIEQTGYDDIDSLKLDYRTLPRYAITTKSADCLRRKCPYFGVSCFVHGSRRRAEAADIVVTNHSLLFCDLVADGGLLPPIRYWVVDEAHGAEAEARRAFSLALSAEDIVRLAGRVDSDEASRNVFVRAERRVTIPSGEEGSTLFYALTGTARAAAKKYATHAQSFAAHMKDLLFFDTNRRGRGYETIELWLNVDIRSSETFARIASYGRLMTDAAEKLVTACQELVGYLEGVDGVAEIQREIASVAIELKEQMHAAEIILDKAPDSYAYAATLSRKNDRVAEKLEALLVNVGGMMNETLFARTHSVVFASATLSVDGGFNAFETALGLNSSDLSTCRECSLDSSYDFDGQMTVYVVADMPEPNDASYLAQLQQLLVETHRAQQGSMLTLFTNRREMERCFDTVQPALKEDDLRLVCQKWGVSVKGLRDDFLADEHLSLFALRSFWEGFDAPGATLKGVIIPKLPFSKPTDPLSCERAARDDQAWRRYVLPQAVLEVKQAAGRLIRKADDKGVLILADRRLITKGYGKAFLNSLPSKTIKVLSLAEIVTELSRTR